MSLCYSIEILALIAKLGLDLALRNTVTLCCNVEPFCVCCLPFSYLKTFGRLTIVLLRSHCQTVNSYCLDVFLFAT